MTEDNRISEKLSLRDLAISIAEEDSKIIIPNKIAGMILSWVF